MAVNKPHGLMVEEGMDAQPSLMGILKKELAHNIRGNNILQNTHRLDKPVSGALLLARKRSVLKLLNEMFAKREIQKTYLAIVSTPPPMPRGELINWLTKDDVAKKAIVRNVRTQLAAEVKLQYNVLQQNKGKILLQINLLTGKYHQIRAQLAYLGCPVVGDDKYGSAEKYKDNAIALHASMLTFKHPVEGNIIAVTAPTPDDELWGFFKL